MTNNNFVIKPIIILGAGGHAKVVAEALYQSKREILGFVTPDKEKGTPFFGSTILGDDDVLSNYSSDDILLVNGMGVLPYQNMRWTLASRMRNQGYTFSTVIHPSAVIASDVYLDEGVQIMAGCVIQPGSHIGMDSIINTGVLLDHDCQVEENCHLAPGVVCSGNVVVGKGTHIGTGSTVIQNISIGGNSVVAASSVIYKDVPCDVKFLQVRETNIEMNES